MLPAGRASSVTTSRSLSASASASVAPTGPAPTMTRSCNIRLDRGVSGSAASARASGFDVGDGLRGRAGQIFVAGGGHQNIVLDPHADVPEFLGHLVGRTDITAGLARETHPGLEPARFSVNPVQADIVHVKPEPMPGAMHIELLVCAGFEHTLEGPRAQLEVDQALCEHALGHLVIVVKHPARLDGVDARELRREHQLINRFLLAAEFSAYRKGARDVRRVTVDLAAGVDQEQVA